MLEPFKAAMDRIEHRYMDIVARSGGRPPQAKAMEMAKFRRFLHDYVLEYKEMPRGNASEYGFQDLSFDKD